MPGHSSCTVLLHWQNARRTTWMQSETSEKHGNTVRRKKRNRFSNNGTTRRLTMSTARVCDARCRLRIENSSGCSFRLLDAKMWIFDWDKTTTDLFHKTTTFRHDTSVSFWKFKCQKEKGKCRRGNFLKTRNSSGIALSSTVKIHLQSSTQRAIDVDSAQKHRQRWKRWQQSWSRFLQAMNLASIQMIL